VKSRNSSAALYRYYQYQDDDTFELIQVAAKLKGKIIGIMKEISPEKSAAKIVKSRSAIECTT
jgi:hypothetical protein